MRKKLLALALTLIPMLGFSQHRSESEAITVAQEFWGNGVNRAKLKAVSHIDLSKAKARAKFKGNSESSITKSGCYIVNDSANERFVIVSAHEHMSDVLGYSNEGMFDVDNIAPGLIDILLSYDAAYDYLMEHPEAQAANYEDAADTYSPVEPLITSKWGQGYPYNIECPVINDTYCKTGCVATAMAQILNYYRSSTHGNGELHYITNQKKIEQDMNFEALDINWDAIQDTYDESSTEEQKSEVAKLMHACGVSLAMDYNTASSGTNYSTVGYAFTKFWNYNPNIAYKHANMRYDEPLDCQMRDELYKGHPILTLLNEVSGGHAAVVDGYDSNGRFHYNFGWEGIGDGYYANIRIVRPADEEGNSLLLRFIKNHYILNISPEECGEPDTDLFVANIVPGFPASVAIGGILKLQYEFDVYDVHTPCVIYGLNEFFGAEIGLALFNEDGTLASTIATAQGDFCPGMTITCTISTKIDSSHFKEGEHYYLTPFYRMMGSDEYCWMKNNGSSSYEEAYYAVRVKDGIVSLVRGDLYSSDSFKEVSMHNEIPGQLASNANLGELNKSEIWTVSGNLNGTDIKYILASIPNSVNCLNLSACNIVEGGDAYYKNNDIAYSTESNVVGPEMFSWLAGVSTIKLPLSTKVVRGSAIHNDYHLTSFIIPDACEVVEDSAIYNCSNLATIHLGKNVREFGSANGIGCYGMLNFSVDEDNTDYKTENGILYSYDGFNLLRCPAAHDNDDSKTFTVPEEVQKIGDYAFQGFSTATSYELHDGIQEIGKYAFAQSKISSLMLPQNLSVIAEGLCQNARYLSSAFWTKNIKAIHPKAFSGCNYLEEICSEVYDIGNVVVLDVDGKSDAFEGISKTCHWRVPLGSAEIYKAQKWWVDTWTIDDVAGIAPTATDNDFVLIPGEQSVDIVCSTDKTINIYNLHGHLVNSVKAKAGQTTTVPLQSGVYLINRNKIRIK